MKTGTRIQRSLTIQAPCRAGNIKVSPQDWLASARVLLIERGHQELSVQKMADRLGVSRGSFHYYFGAVDVLYDKLIDDWESSNLLLPQRPETLSSAQAQACLNQLCHPDRHPGQFDPQWELAVREWARASPRILARVRHTDSRRLTTLHEMLIAAGHLEQQAAVLAPLIYELKIGWLATDLAERPAQTQRQAQNLLCEIIAAAPPARTTVDPADRRRGGRATTTVQRP